MFRFKVTLIETESENKIELPSPILEPKSDDEDDEKPLHETEKESVPSNKVLKQIRKIREKHSRKSGKKEKEKKS